MDKLFDEFGKFCKGEYGRECDVYAAFIARKDPNNYPAKVEEFDGVGADLLETVRNHLKQARDFIMFQFTQEEQEFDVQIVPATETEYLATRIQEEDMEQLEETDTVVLVEEDGLDVAVPFLEQL